MTEATADLCDEHPDMVAAVDGLRNFGAPRFSGVIETVRVRKDNSLVRQVLSSPGDRRVLVVDGGACPVALVGDKLASLAIQSGWAGVVVNGFVRDTYVLRDMPLGVLALGAKPCRSFETFDGERGVTVTFLGAMFQPGSWLCADEDGVIVAPQSLASVGK